MLIFDLVTVKDKQYYIYNYVGNLRDGKNVSIVLSYPKDAFQKNVALKTFISLDKSLAPLDILTQYAIVGRFNHFLEIAKYTAMILITLILDINLLKKSIKFQSNIYLRNYRKRYADRKDF